MCIFAIIVNDDGENPNEAGLNVRASIEFVVLLVFYLDMCRDSRTLAAGEAAFAGIIYDLDIVCNLGIIAVSFNSMLLAVVGEDDLTVVLDLGRSFVVARAPFVVALGECDLLLRDSHGDLAGNSGVEVRVGGREDYIKFIHASIADRGFCIVLIRPCERALNRLAVKGCSAGRNERGEQIAVGGVDRIRRDRRGILIRSRSRYNSYVSNDINRLLIAAVDRNRQRLCIKHMVLVCLQNNRDTVSCASLESLFLKLIAIFIKAGGTHRQTRCRRLYCQARDRLSLGKVADGYHGRGDLLLGDREGCILNSHALIDSAVVSIRLSSDSVCTGICCSNIQFIAVVDNEASSVVAFCILHLEGDEAGDVLIRSRRCTHGEHFVATVCDFSRVNSGSTNGWILSTSNRQSKLF